jgi:hypothetical protein
MLDIKHRARGKEYQCLRVIGINEKVDFAVAFYMVHEVPDAEAFLLVEPKIHVTSSHFEEFVDLACATGMKPCSEPKISMSRVMLSAPC